MTAPRAVFTQAEFGRALKLAGLYDADDPDLAAFRADGGKLILWQGWADQAISPYGTIDYYTAVARPCEGRCRQDRPQVPSRQE